MLQEERFYKIIAFLKEKQRARFSDIAEYLNISEGTVRRDLLELEKREIVQIVRGGVIWGKSDLARGKSNTRKIINKGHKEELVNNLGSIVENGYAICINGGTTSVEAAKYLALNYSKMTIITNSLEVIDIMKVNEGFRLVLVGGIYENGENTIVGKQASKGMAAYNTDLAIISVGAISLEKGITDFRSDEIEVINAMIENSKKRIIIADHTKFDKIDCMNICPLDKIDVIMTDSMISAEVKEKYSKKGIEVIM